MYKRRMESEKEKRLAGFERERGAERRWRGIGRESEG